MNTVIITNAGISSRFNRGMAPEQVCLKAIYHDGEPKDTLLYHMLQKCDFADRIILVGGYLIDDLEAYVSKVVPQHIRERLHIVCNPRYKDLTSGYSLYVGVLEALKDSDTTTILFAEGDLDLDDDTFQCIAKSDKNVLTTNSTPIFSNKAVVLYQNDSGRYRYAFNAEHGFLRIEEPFSCIFNSGQVWKFTDMQKLKESAEHFCEKDIKGTNLVIVQDYLDHIEPEEIEVFSFKRWVNCNTREDFAGIQKSWHER